MALTIIDPQFVPDLATRLSGLGIQTDPNAMVLGGTKGVFDFIGDYAPDSLTQSQVAPGYIVGQPVGRAGLGGFANIHSNKGLLRDDALKSFPFAPSAGSMAADQAIAKASPWNLRTYGDYASLIMEHWVTITEDGMGGSDTGGNLLGYGHQNSTHMQWGITVAQGTNQLQFRLPGWAYFPQPQVTTLEGRRNIPLQIVMAPRRDSPTATTFTTQVFVNKTLVTTLPSRNYPFIEPNDFPTLVAAVQPGYMTLSGGFGNTVRGKYHRSSITQIAQDWTDAQVLGFISERYDAIQPLLAA